jgi:Ca2+-binding RTX toxin-like protein
MRKERLDGWMVRSLPRVLAVAMCASVVLAGACSSKPDEGDATGGSGGTKGGSGAKAGSKGSKGGSNGTGGSAASGSGGEQGGALAEGGSGADGDEPVLAGDGTELDPGADGGGFDGIVVTGTDFVRAVAGCSAFDPASGALALALDAAAPSAVIRVSGGVVTVNGKPCVSADGKTKASAALVKSLGVTGGAEDSLVYIDGGAAFGEDLLAGGGFAVDLGDGFDILGVLGSTGSDEVRLGSDGAAVVIDFNADLAPDVRALGADQVLVSTGPMPDQILGDGLDLGLMPVTVPMKLYGGGANDVLLGGAGDDELSGGIGNDTFLAGRDRGADLFAGGDGEDFVDYAGRSAPISVTTASGADDGEATEHDQVDQSVENVRGGSGDDHLTGSSAANKLWGGPGNDVLAGGDGNDFLYGGDGDDTLDGQDGDDYLYGEAGDDRLTGGNGDDLLDGYPGSNTLDGGGGAADICVPTVSDTAAACEL